MKAILTGKRFEDTGFSIDIDFQEDNGTSITTKTLMFSGASTDLSMQTVRDRVAVEAERLTRIQAVNEEPDADLGTDLLA